jgi:hypothetical protein
VLGNALHDPVHASPRACKPAGRDHADCFPARASHRRRCRTHALHRKSARPPLATNDDLYLLASGFLCNQAEAP